MARKRKAKKKTVKARKRAAPARRKKVKARRAAPKKSAPKATKAKASKRRAAKSRLPARASKGAPRPMASGPAVTLIEPRQTPFPSSVPGDRPTPSPDGKVEN